MGGRKNKNIVRILTFAEELKYLAEPAIMLREKEVKTWLLKLTFLKNMVI